jgi:NitT/TauT family transport system permease protein
VQEAAKADRLAVLICQVGLLVAVAALWEAASRLGWVDPELLPPFSTVVATLWDQLQEEEFLADIRVTLVETAVAFTIVVPLGLLSGFFIGERRTLYRVANPTLQLLVATPKAIFLPIFIIAFGIGFVEKIAFACMVGIFVTILSGITAVHSVPQGLVTATRSLGATPIQLYWRIYLPAMTPIILEGIRIAFIFTIFGVLLSEMYAASNGLGHAIFGWGLAYRMTPLLAGVLLVVVITVALTELMRSLEKAYYRRRGIRR